MGGTASVIAAVAPPTIAILLLLLVLMLVGRVEKHGGYVEIDWKTVAFRVKASFSPECPAKDTGRAADPAASEQPAVAGTPQPAPGVADPPNGGGGP
jgi:hypothetical protein